MHDYKRTFATRVLSFEDALAVNGMMGDGLKALEARHPGKAHDAGRDIWAGLVGLQGTGGPVETAITMTTPADNVPLLRRADSVAAAFAFRAACEHFADVSLADGFALRGAMEKAWLDFEQRRLEANAIEGGFGCDDSPSWHTLRDIGTSPGSAAFKKKILEIAKLAGRIFKAMGHMKKRAPANDPHSVKGIDIGGQVERLTSSELGKLATPETEDQTAMRVLKKQAMQRKMVSVQEKSRGPLVVVVDESESMHEEFAGVRGRNTWAKAVMIALARIAWNEDRTVRVVHFGNGVVTQDVPKNDHRALFEAARSFLSGGTDFVGSLEQGMRSVGDLEKEGHKGADVVYITDGEEWGGFRRNSVRAQLDTIIDRMDTDGVKLWDVAIGQHHDVEFPLRKRAERYTFAHDRDLKNIDRAADVAKGLSDAAKVEA